MAPESDQKEVTRNHPVVLDRPKKIKNSQIHSFKKRVWAGSIIYPIFWILNL